MSWYSRFAIVVVVLVVPVVSGIYGQAPLEVAVIVERAAAREKQSVASLQNLAWTTVVRHEVFDKNGRAMKTDYPCEVTYETIVSLKPLLGVASTAFPIRTSTLKLVDGKRVKPDYKLPRYYPAQGSHMAIFLVQGNDTFSYGGYGDLRGRDALMLDFSRPADKEKVPRIVRGDNRHLFSVAGIALTGKVWIDPETFDVLQIDLRAGPVDLAEGDKTLHYERRWTMRFQFLTFENPEQVFLAPESYEVETRLDGESPAIERFVETYQDFKRFTGEVRITPVKE